MSIKEEILPLRSETDSLWVDVVEADLNSFLLDHAACERKASALAMSMVVKYPDRPALLEPMICLAKEELAHFHEVFLIIMKRKLQFSHDEKDPYLNQLLKSVRHGRENHFLDRLLISSIVEARGCERFLLLGRSITNDTWLADFYLRLGREEAGHYKIFHRIASHYFDKEVVKDRFDQLLDTEASIISELPIRPAVH